jgi:hypothetical protein
MQVCTCHLFSTINAYLELETFQPSNLTQIINEFFMINCSSIFCGNNSYHTLLILQFTFGLLGLYFSNKIQDH